MSIQKKTKSILFALGKICITLVIFYVIFRKVNVASALDFSRQNKHFLLLAVVLAIGLVFLQGLRWNFLLQAIGLDAILGKDIESVWAGHFLNNVLPTSAAGDVVRSYALRFRGANQGQWVSALLLEKLWAVLTALALAVSVAFSADLVGMPTSVKVIVLAAFLCGLGVTMFLNLLIRLGRNTFSPKAIVFLELLTAFIKSAWRNRNGRRTLLVSFLINVGICLIFYCIVLANGAELTVLQCCFVVPVFTILSGLPISYGGWGVRELSGIHLLNFYGLSPELAFSVTLLFGLVVLASSLPGIFALRSFRHVFKSRPKSASAI